MRMRYLLVAAALLVSAASCCPKGEVRPTRNLIVMISDGTSEGVLAAARWYERYMTGNPDFNLNMDPYICGLVQTFESDCPITCSAPGMSAYMTGVRERQNNVSIYPIPHPGQDFWPTDSVRAGQPAATVLEAAKHLKGKSTGLVCTVEFPQATPAAASAHYPYRWSFNEIALQQCCEGLDVVFGGSSYVLTDEMRGMIAETGAVLLEDDVEAFRALSKGQAPQRVWAMFGEDYPAFEIDRDDSREPSLSEMTATAINLLNRNKKGFFLMVEGSKVDYAAHANEPVTALTDFLEFDRAVKVAIDFARKEGNTTVIVSADHGNSGIQLGGGGLADYENTPLDSFFVGVRGVKASYKKMVELLQGCRASEIASVFQEWTGISLTPSELADIKRYMKVDESDYMQVSNSWSLMRVVSGIYRSRSHITTVGGDHTGEDVFLGVYNPRGQRPAGVISNVQLNEYMCRVLGLRGGHDALVELTDELFAPQDKVFWGYDCSIETGGEVPVLVVKGASAELRIPAYHNVVYRSLADGKADSLRTKAPTYYDPERGRFYLDRSLAELAR